MSHGTRIPFRGEADEAPNTTPGDVLVVLQQKAHEVFKRDGHNLFIKKQITLQEALCGFQFKLVHLDGRVLKIKSEEGAVYTPGSFKAIRDEGMPHEKHPLHKGSLYIEFDVVFPKASELDKKTRSAVAKLLPGPEAPTATDSNTTAANGKSKEKEKEKDKEVDDKDGVVEEVMLVDVNMEEERGRHEQSHREAYHDDEEEGGGGGPRRAGCRTQ